MTTASRTGRVVAIRAYVSPSFWETVSWLMSGFGAVSDWPTTIVTWLVYVFGWRRLTMRAAATARTTAATIIARRVRMTAS